MDQAHSNKTNLTSHQLDQVTAFTALLVELITGLQIEEIPEDKLNGVIDECLNIYMEFMNEYVQKTHGKRKALQLDILQSKGDLSLLERFEDLDSNLQDAHSAFVSQLKTI